MQHILSTPRASGIAMPLDGGLFRSGMSRLAAAVNVITTFDGAERYGFTASAVSSVTDTPPTLLVCVNRNARSHPVIAATRVLCVNTLSGTQKEIAAIFAGSKASMEERFALGEWEEMVTGAPTLKNAAVSFDCRVNEMKELGTHDVLFCDVVAVRCGERAEGLAYFDRRFHPLA